MVYAVWYLAEALLYLPYTLRHYGSNLYGGNFSSPKITTAGNRPTSTVLADLSISIDSPSM